MLIESVPDFRFLYLIKNQKHRDMISGRFGCRIFKKKCTRVECIRVATKNIAKLTFLKAKIVFHLIFKIFKQKKKN